MERLTLTKITAMFNKFISFTKFWLINALKLDKILQSMENIGTWVVVFLTVAFVFTGVMTNHDVHWWIGVSVCFVIWCFILLKRHQLIIPIYNENECDIQILFWCILFLGFVIRFFIALVVVTKLKSDLFWLSKYISEWSKGNFIETKSLLHTALYSFFQWLAGPSLQLSQIINAFLGSLQIILAFDLAKRIFKNSWIALAAAAITAFHPTFITLTLGLYTELLFGIFMLLSFRAFAILSERIDKQLYDMQTFFESVKLALCCLGLFYTRGNGFFLILLSLVMLLLVTKFNKKSFAKVFLPYLSTTLLIMLVIGLLNIKILGHFIISSSEDSYWPLLFGSCVETKGIFSPSDASLIKAQYYEIHPEMKGRSVHTHELIPLIKKEFFRRWHDNTLQMINLSMTKYKSMWGNDDNWVFYFVERLSFKEGNLDILRFHTRRLKQIGAICLACWLILLPGMQASSRRTVMLMLLFLFMNIINHFFVEAAFRYSYPLTVILSVLTPGVILLKTNK